jgi:hypothetical protein
MQKPRGWVIAAAALFLAGVLLACFGSDAPGRGPAPLQFTSDSSQRKAWEDFLITAEIVSSEQMGGSEAVTKPWILTLKKGAVTHRGLWKNAQGRMGGYWEGWTYEIAAYQLDKLLGLGMVPPTVERRFRGERGSCQYWIDDSMSLRDRDEKRIKMPLARTFLEPGDLQRLFDNLIASEDRTEQRLHRARRMILIDHSRSFRTSGRFVKALLYSAKNPEGPKLMSELPRAIVDKVRSLDLAGIKAVVGEYLTGAEIEAVLVRRDLILQEIDRLIKVNGESKVLY